MEDQGAPLNVYLDNAAATRLDERVLEAMKPYFFETYAVATSEFGYSMGIDARETLERSNGTWRRGWASTAEELIFTSGDTESSNMAFKGVALALGEKKGKHLVSAHRGLPGAQYGSGLGAAGFKVTYLTSTPTVCWTWKR